MKSSSRDTLYGWHPVREALRSRRRSLRALRLRARCEHGQALAALAEAAEVPVTWQAADVFDRDVPRGVVSQGVALDAGALPECTLEEWIGQAGGEPRCLVALDGVEDPRNLGAIARAADGAGASALLMTTRRAPPLSAAASRASAGALETLPVVRTPNLARALEALAGQGFWSVGADPEANQTLFDTNDRVWEGNLVVVLGSEGEGIRPGVSKKLDHRVSIPMLGEAGSLNVASAATLILYERVRRARVAGA